MSRSTPAAEKGTAIPRRLSWQCIFEDCGHNFTTTTRRGEKVTCPKCHRTMAGPARVRAMEAELEDFRMKAKQARRPVHGKSGAEPARSSRAAKVRVVATKPKTPPPTPPAAAVTKPEPAPAAPAAPPAAPPAEPKHGRFGQLMGWD